jgi:glyoxylase-like metal-dependent hydrolase (beta-lactamase superfamily II)
MTEFSRRAVLAGAAAAGAGSVLADLRPAFAAAPPKGTQAPGFYRFKLGTYEITAITDGHNSFPLPDKFVVNKQKDEVNAALQAAFLPKDRMTIPYTAVIVNTGSKLIAIDTANGIKEPKATNGKYIANMAAAGIDPKAIDTVIISHYHGDHINGLIGAGNSAAFPNAEVLVGAAEHKYFMDEGEMSRAKGPRMPGVFKNAHRVFKNAEVAKRVKTYDPGKEIAPGITSVATYGHTPGHMSFIVASGNGKLFVQSDVTNHPALFVRNPGWHAFFDQDPKMAETTRRKIYDMLAAERMLMAGYHYPFPAVAHVEKSGDGYREQMVQWSTTL